MLVVVILCDLFSGFIFCSLLAWKVKDVPAESDVCVRNIDVLNNFAVLQCGFSPWTSIRSQIWNISVPQYLETCTFQSNSCHDVNLVSYSFVSFSYFSLKGHFIIISDALCCETFYRFITAIMKYEEQSHMWIFFDIINVFLESILRECEQIEWNKKIEIWQ